MKTSLIIGMMTAAITLAPGTSSANSEDNKYPATNFQPKVIYQDESAVQATGGETTAFDPDYPATSFQPKIIYQDENAAKAPSPKKHLAEKSVFDPKYPAATFEPKVIYP